MSENKFEMEVDNQSEDGEIKKSPGKDIEEFRYVFYMLILLG